MYTNLMINGTGQEVEFLPSETLFTILRRLGYHGVKFGDEHGLTGSDTVLLDGHPVNSGSLLAAQAAGHNTDHFLPIRLRRAVRLPARHVHLPRRHVGAAEHADHLRDVLEQGHVPRRRPGSRAPAAYDPGTG